MKVENDKLAHESNKKATQLQNTHCILQNK